MEEPTTGDGWSLDLGSPPPRVLHLRLLRVEAAEDRLHAWLDALVAHGRTRGTVVHGKSGGALRAMVREVLREDPRVDGVRSVDETGRANPGAVSFGLS